MEQNVKRAWPAFRSMQGSAASWRSDLVAVLTLVAIAAPEQMTAAAQGIAAGARRLFHSVDAATRHLAGGAAFIPSPAVPNPAANKPS